MANTLKPGTNTDPMIARLVERSNQQDKQIDDLLTLVSALMEVKAVRDDLWDKMGKWSTDIEDRLAETEKLLPTDTIQ